MDIWSEVNFETYDMIPGTGSGEEGTLKMLRTSLKKSAFKHAGSSGSVKENLYYVRNDRRMLITTYLRACH